MAGPRWPALENGVPPSCSSSGLPPKPLLPSLKGTPRSAVAGPGWGLGCPGAGQASQWAEVTHTHTHTHTHTPAHSDRLSPPQTGASMPSEPAVSMAGRGADGSQWARGLKLPLRPPPRTVAVSTFPSPSQVPPVSLCSHPPHTSLCPAQQPVKPPTSLDTSNRREPRDPSVVPAAPKMQPCLAC